MKRQRGLLADGRIGSVDVHGDAAGVDAQVTDLAASGLQFVDDGVGNIDRGWRRRAVGHQLQIGGMDRAAAVHGLAIGSDFGRDIGQHGDALALLDHAGSHRIKVLQAYVGAQWRLRGVLLVYRAGVASYIEQSTCGKTGSECERKGLDKGELLHRQIQIAVGKRGSGRRQVRDRCSAVHHLELSHGEVGQRALFLGGLRAAGSIASDVGEVPYPLGVVHQVDRRRLGHKAGHQQLPME